MEFFDGVEASDPDGRDAGNDGPRGNRSNTPVTPNESGRNHGLRRPDLRV